MRENKKAINGEEGLFVVVHHAPREAPAGFPGPGDSNRGAFLQLRAIRSSSPTAKGRSIKNLSEKSKYFPFFNI
jgi:hypothetical protein